MTRTRVSKAFCRLAVEAGIAAGVPTPPADTPPEMVEVRYLEAVSLDEDARARRDAAWLEYEAILLDATWQVVRIQSWLRDRGVEVGTSSVQRDRDSARAKIQVHELSTAKAKAVFSKLEGLSGRDLQGGAGKLAMQMIVNFLLTYDADRLQDLEPADVVKLIHTAGQLGKTLTESNILEVKLAAMRREFDAAVKKTRAPDGKLGPAQIDEIRRAVFGA